MPIPIIFIHQGWDRYLETALLQARRSNPDAPIFLLGGHKPGGFEGVTSVEDAEIFESAAAFAPFYRHLSAHAVHFELFCLQRWFILSAFLQREKIPRCFVLDSDVLLFTDVTQDAARFSQFDLTHLSPAGPLNGFVNSPETLAGFCDFITKFYTHDIEHWTHWFADFRARGGAGGITDMMVFQEFRQQFHRQFCSEPPRFADLTSIRDGTAYDHNINVSDGYQMKIRRKKLRWKDGFPHAFHLESGRWIRFHSLHFQGHAKPLMRGTLNGNRVQWFQGTAQIEWQYFLTRVKNKLRQGRSRF